MSGFQLVGRMCCGSGPVVALVVVSLMAWPLVSILPHLVEGGSAIYGGTYLLKSALTTAFFALFVGTITCFMGSSAAWIVSCYDFRGRKLVRYMLVLPLVIPIYVCGYTYYQYIANPRWLYIVADKLDVSRTSASYIYNMLCASVVMIFAYYPYVYLLSLSKMQRIADIIVVSRTLGYRGIRLFSDIILSSTRPALILGVILVVMEVITEYGMTNYYGLDTMVNVVYRLWFNAQDYSRAAGVTITALFLSWLVFLAGQYARRNSNDNFANYEVHSHLVMVPGLRGLALLSYCLGLVALGFFLPVAQLIVWSIDGASMISIQKTLLGTWHSIEFAMIVAAIAVSASLIMNYILYACGNRLADWISSATLMGYAVPGSILAISILGAGGKAGVLCLIYAYLYRFLGVAHRSIGVGFGQIGGDIVHSMRVYYAHIGWLSKIRECAPFIMSNASVAFALVFIDMMKELPITLILRPFNYDTLTTQTYELVSDERYRDASVSSMAIILISLTMLWAIFKQVPRQPAGRDST